MKMLAIGMLCVAAGAWTASVWAGDTATTKPASTAAAVTTEPSTRLVEMWIVHAKAMETLAKAQRNLGNEKHRLEKLLEEKRAELRGKTGYSDEEAVVPALRAV